MAAAVIMLPGFDNVYARGGGHMGGGRMGGGWSGGRMGGGGFERGGGERGRGGEGRHERHNNNNNNNNNSGNNVNVYGNNGGWGWGWGAADGAIAGLAVGAAIGEADQPSTIIVEQPPATAVQQSAPGSTAYGTQVTVLPPGSVSRNVNGTMAYECGSVWYRPYFGSSGVYYEIVPPPPADKQ